jgi:hypothetical protein
VFAHESCRIFGAADEYGTRVCGATSGHLAVSNSNCVSCFPPGTQLSCLMNANMLDMCIFSQNPDRLGRTPVLTAGRLVGLARLGATQRRRRAGVRTGAGHHGAGPRAFVRSLYRQTGLAEVVTGLMRMRARQLAQA